MEVIRDNRPFIKTSIDKGKFFEISRKNQTTGQMYFVRIDKQIYISFLKSQRKESELDFSGLTKEQKEFIVRNILKGEKRN